MACLQIYRELLSLTIFLLVHSNSKEVNYLSYQAKIFLVNLTSRELTPCKISHICHCAFKVGLICILLFWILFFSILFLPVKSRTIMLKNMAFCKCFRIILKSKVFNFNFYLILFFKKRALKPPIFPYVMKRSVSFYEVTNRWNDFFVFQRSYLLLYISISYILFSKRC